MERFFRDLTVECVREGSFRSVAELVEQIEHYLAARQLNPKRYVWRADGQKILEKIERARRRLQEEEAAKAAAASIV